MSSPGAQQAFIRRPTPVILGLLAANVLAYVAELVFIRLGFDVTHAFGLSPRGVFERGYLWQPLTYLFLHAPSAPMHLGMNMLMLWLFGPTLESWWGGRRLLIAYFVCGLGGATLTLLVGLVSRLDFASSALVGYWDLPHVGASGAILGLAVAWGTTFARQKFNFLLLGEITGRTLVLIVILIELLGLLSLEQGTSSTSHFGGMIAAFILTKGLWRPSRWKESFTRRSLEARRKKLEKELRVIEGGKGRDEEPSLPSDPKKWN